MRLTMWLILMFAFMTDLAAETTVPHMFRQHLERLETEVEQVPDGTLDKVETLFQLGRLNDAEQQLDRLDASPETALLRAKIAYTRYDFAAFQEIMADLPETEAVFAWQSRFWRLSDDLASYRDSSLARVDQYETANLNLAAFAYLMFDYDEAKARYQKTVETTSDSTHVQRALVGLADVAYKRNNYDAALDYLVQALVSGAPNSDLADEFTWPLVRLGRVNEAIEMAKIAVALNPYNEAAHYTLGNGYTDLNYSQLETHYPQAFATGDARQELDDLTQRWANGEPVTVDLTKFAEKHPENVEALNLLGSIAWNARNYDDAIAYYQKALTICPDYGRSHNGLAKSLEKKRMAISVYFATDESTFAAREMPQIEAIETFVINWESLSPRHQKRVALSLAPFQQFVPVLAKAEATVYIKPLHEKLSECPHMTAMSDTRISYDSRLWDDVRGAGGYHMITGIEDVERSIYHKYDTVLHEFAHQVHGTFPTEDWLRVEAAYKAAKANEDADRKTFISRYQGSSVWEYFAEGINAYFSPKRDEFDTREIVRERLFELDPALVELVQSYMAETDMARFFGTGIAAAIYDKISTNDLDAVRQLIAGQPTDVLQTEAVLSARSYFASILGETEQAIALARELVGTYPAYSGSHQRLAHALFMQDGDYQSRLQHLADAEREILPADRANYDAGLGAAALDAGDYSTALAAFDRVLADQADQENALWGKAFAYSQLDSVARADDFYRQTLLRRHGIVDLRTEYGHFLLDHGQKDAARQQLDEAATLDADDVGVLVLQARFETDPQQAIALCERALADKFYYDSGRLWKAQFLLDKGDHDAAAALIQALTEDAQKPPRWHYRPDEENFVLINTWEAQQFAHLQQLQAALTGAVTK